MECYTAIPEPLVALLKHCLPLPLFSCLLTGFKCLNFALSYVMVPEVLKWS